MICNARAVNRSSNCNPGSQTFTFGKSLAVIHEEHLEGSMEPLQLEDEALSANVVEALRFVGISAV
jgi:hypothetical protein